MTQWINVPVFGLDHKQTVCTMQCWRTDFAKLGDRGTAATLLWHTISVARSLRSQLCAAGWTNREVGFRDLVFVFKWCYKQTWTYISFFLLLLTELEISTLWFHWIGNYLEGAWLFNTTYTRHSLNPQILSEEALLDPSFCTQAQSDRRNKS